MIIAELSKLCNIVEISNTAYPKIDEIDDDIKNYIRNLLKLNPATVEYFENKCKDLPKNYNLIHYRLGDSYLINERPLEGTWVEHFKSHKKDNCVLISDSLEFKHQINDEFNKDKTEVYVFLDKPCHTIPGKGDYLNTISDFTMIKNADHIFTFRRGGGCTSNFVFWTSLVYNIPFTRID